MEGVGYAKEQMEGRIGFTGIHVRLEWENEQQKVCEVLIA